MDDTANVKLIPPRLCRYCHEPFTPRQPAQQFCPKPSRCVYHWQSRARRGVPPLAAILRRRQMRVAFIAAVLEQRFGALTTREQDIFQLAHKHGYNAGYVAGIAPLRRTIA